MLKIIVNKKHNIYFSRYA